MEYQTENSKEVEVLEQIKNEIKKDLIVVSEFNQTKLIKVWVWFQKHAFTTVIFIALGIWIGVNCSKVAIEQEVKKAINIQRFEFNGDLFEVHPSSIQKYYNNNKEISTIKK